jgi:hypothetical protein
MDQTMNRNILKNAVIAAGASQSEIVNLQGVSLLAIEMPGEWTTADITFLAANDPASTFLPIYDDAGAEVKVASANAVASRMITLDAAALKLAPYQFIKIRSGVAATPVNQAAARALKLIGKA